jgi:hypothetical protein
MEVLVNQIMLLGVILLWSEGGILDSFMSVCCQGFDTVHAYAEEVIYVAT